MRQSQQPAQPVPAELRLGDVPVRLAVLDPEPVVAARSARHEYHRGRGDPCGEGGGHDEAVDIRKLNVEQNQVWAELTTRVDRLGPGGGLPDDKEAVRRQELARDRPEGGMIVHDQDPGDLDRMLVPLRFGGGSIIVGVGAALRAGAGGLTHGMPR